MTQKKALLLTDDITAEPGPSKRLDAMKTCAVALAQRLETSIDLVHVESTDLYPVKHPFYKTFMDQYLAQQKSQLTELAKSIRVKTRSLFIKGEPVQAILKLSSKPNAYEMVLLGTHGRTGFNRLLLGSVTDQVIRHSTIPVLSVGPKAQRQANRFLSQASPKILVPTSLMKDSEGAELYAASLAKRLGGNVLFFHSIYETLDLIFKSATITKHGANKLKAVLEDINSSARNRLQTLVQNLQRQGIPADWSIDIRATSAGESVLKKAQESNASLITIGTRGRSLVSGAIFGRTAMGVVINSPVPVITVRARPRNTKR
jgi:nucleotide-binding universal stress UspA family protein